MKDILSVFRYERYRTTRNIVRMLSVVLVLMTFFGFSWGLYDMYYRDFYSTPQPDPAITEIGPERRAELAEEYADRIAVLDQLVLQAEMVGAPDRVLKVYERERAELRFYLETGTVEWDFLQADDILDPTQGVNGGSFAFSILVALRYLLYVYAIFLGASSFSAEHRSGTMRTLVASPISRRDIILGKFLYLAFETAATVFLAAAVAVGVSALYGIEAPPILVRTATSFRETTALALVLVRFFSTWVGMVFLAALAATVGIVLRSSVAGLAIPAGFLMVSYGIFASIVMGDYSFNRTIDPERLASGFPVIALDLHLQGWNLDFTVAVLLHLAMAGGLLWISHIAFRRQNI